MTVTRACLMHAVALVVEDVDDKLVCPVGLHAATEWAVVDEITREVYFVATMVRGPIVVAAGFDHAALHLHLGGSLDAVVRAAGRRPRRAGAA